ncbi:tripartite motif-containing protein 16-like [Xyrauchen texanus]|uniref:tripartite motif-containing protein 16-like n=1 Tax=Xyrauchen texanus TaxID=154827 RepID=UPI002241C9D6|nr:tripartite motif-containing protein 16-like [Xyrauchen texanus]
MAEASILWAHEQFRCSVCLDLLKDPVTIPCGHSYCRSCITDCWNQDDQKGVYSCPQCRQIFSTRPALGKNVVFAEMVEKLKAGLLFAYSGHYARPGDVECDVCTGRKYKAVKSCLTCLNSYCQSHLEQHENFFKSKRHDLIKATGRIQEMICSQHYRLQEVFCRTDQQCICMKCVMDNHKNHDTVSAEAERAEKQKQLEDTRRKFQQKIDEKEKELQKLREAVKTHKHSAQAAVEDNEWIFTELIRSIERRRSEVTQLIRDQEKAAVSRAEGLLERLKQEIDDLRRRDTELEQLSHTEDLIHFLQSFQSLSVLPGSADSVTLSSHLSFNDVGKSVSLLREKLDCFCKEGLENIFGKVTYIEIVATPEPSTREEFLRYSFPFSLDLNTPHKYLHLSEEKRVATFIGSDQQYPDHPDRFDVYSQVLCSESVCGRCYWEVECNKSDNVCISVSYKSISRKGVGAEGVFGFNDQSWRLSCSYSSYAFRHNNNVAKLSVVPSSSRIGVYVDHSAGILSFYSVSDTMTLIHREQTTFTQPLYPGFGINQDSTVKLCHPSI